MDGRSPLGPGSVVLLGGWPGELTLGSGGCGCGRPPGKVVEQETECGLGRRVGWMRGTGAERAVDEGNDHVAWQRDHLRLDGYLRQVLDSSGAPVIPVL
jgi:hypothetical protein